MNRHARRASVKSIRHNDFITHLIAANLPLGDHATLRDAVMHWRSNIEARRPICVGCRASFVGEQAKVGAFLLSVPIGVPDIVATSVFCAECHDTLSSSEVDAISTRVLMQLSPGGRFLDAW